MKSLANESDVIELRERLEKLSGQEQAAFGTMTVPVMVCHVREAFRAAREGQPLTPGAKLPLPKTVVKWFALKAPMRWPTGLKTSKELELGQPGTVPVEFARDLAGALRELRWFCDVASTSEHPFFGKMSRADWLRWGYLHVDHHLRQFGR